MLPDAYIAVVNNIKVEPATQDFVHIALAKILHCIKDSELKTAKTLLYYLQVGYLWLLKRDLRII